MIEFNISVPSKTFLLGEYLALKGGPAILLSTRPSFCMNVYPASSCADKATFVNSSQGSDERGEASSKRSDPNDEAIAEGAMAEEEERSGKAAAVRSPDEFMKVAADNSSIHPSSPAGRWIKKLSDFYSAYSFKFIDPYDGLGGFGASSAQFVMLYGLMQYTNGTVIDEWEMIRDYKSCAWNGKGIIPSGADAIAQLKGGVCLFHHTVQKVQTLAWPFPDLEYGIIRTSHKLATYEHLKDLPDFDTSALFTIVEDAYKCIEDADSQGFIDALNLYGAQLKRQSFLMRKTEKILNLIRRCSIIPACKGCGALGADVILILFYKEKWPQVSRWIKEQNLHLITYGQEVAQGLVIKKGS